mgnify:CR=1 FL=1
MSKIALSLKINVSQIDKARLFAGQKGKYLDATIFVDLSELDQYGNSGMITQDVSKEEKGQSQGSYQQQAPQQQQGGFGQQQQQPSQQLAQKRQQAQQQSVNTNGPIDFDDDLAF